MAMIARRQLGLGLLAMGAVCLLPSLPVRSQETAAIEWRVPREKVPTVREQLDFRGKVTGDPATVEDNKGLPLIYVLVGAVALGVLAKTLLDVYRDAKYGGIIITVPKGSGKLKIENDPRIPGGTIIIRNQNKVEVKFSEKDSPQPSDLVKALEPLLKK